MLTVRYCKYLNLDTTLDKRCVGAREDFGTGTGSNRSAVCIVLTFISLRSIPTYLASTKPACQVLPALVVTAPQCKVA